MSGALLIGIDLAWGEKKRDGVCAVDVSGKAARVLSYHYPHGDDELLQTLQTIIGKRKTVFATIDAPIVCPNRTGTRPVDRLTHRMFHREHAACHPANFTKCPRPPRLLARLEKAGFRAGWGFSGKTACEVYPHPAMVRLFGLPRIIKYKKGRVREKRGEFRRLQRCIRACLAEHFSYLEIGKETDSLLRAAWNKEIEDCLDAFFCALIALWHWKHRSRRSEVIGDLRTGFILLPRI